MASIDAPKPAEGSASSTHTPARPQTHDSSSSTTEPTAEATTEPTLAEKIELAAAEGHDADVPSNIGYVLDEQGEKQRRESITQQRRESALARQSTRGSKAAGEDVEKAAAAAGAEGEVADENIVQWDGPDDPQNPYNWPRWKKVTTCALVSSFTFVTPLASSMFAPGVPELMMEFKNSSPELASFVVSVYILGFAAGPLVFAPMSEIYGRHWVYLFSLVFFGVFIVACAVAPTLEALIAFRFLSGIFGACPLTNGAGTIADMIAQEKRGAAMAIFSIGPLLGPIIGPVAGGFLADAKGWRWVFWVLAIIIAALVVAIPIFMQETYAPVLLERKTRRLRKETGNDLLRSKFDVGLSPKDHFKRGIVRPMKLLAFDPISIIFGFYLAVVYGYLYILFTSITTVFQGSYGFSASNVGLVFLGLGVGSMLGVVVFSVFSDRNIKKKTQEADELAAEAGTESEGMKPEYRLSPLRWGAALLPFGFFFYGWTAEFPDKVHWIVPIISHVFIGVGNIIVFLALQLYLVDAYTIYAASAIAANTVVRSIAGAVLPLAGLRMYANLGVGWGNSLLGFIALALLPVPFLIIRYGEFLRKNYSPKNL
ncbi:related to multidrug resistant protein [Cephalotrichum gorgonifer]|uniref:Related to multidrug resistant protein n=1 Tax=Cephalotrichum gorgonifer TaxID=2041049 RepID=A0AAE8MYF7_9PEZI|nr:related to multidrug resistant protein [Cephalotrichum gorgonifer]